MAKIPYLAPNDFDEEYFFKEYFAKKLQEKLVIPGTMWENILKSKNNYSMSNNISLPPTSNSSNGLKLTEEELNRITKGDKNWNTPTLSQKRKLTLTLLSRNIWWLLNNTFDYCTYTINTHKELCRIISKSQVLNDDNNIFLQELSDSTDICNDRSMIDRIDHIIFIAENYLIYVNNLIREKKIEIVPPKNDSENYINQFEDYFDKISDSLKRLKGKKREIRNGIRICRTCFINA